MFQTKTSKTIILKSGLKILSNSEVEVKPLNTTYCGIIYKQINGPDIKVKMYYTVAHEYLIGFVKPPNIKSLEKKFSGEGSCTTPIGNTVEVDGEDHYGFPSWCRVLLGI